MELHVGQDPEPCLTISLSSAQRRPGRAVRHAPILPLVPHAPGKVLSAQRLLRCSGSLSTDEPGGYSFPEGLAETQSRRLNVMAEDGAGVQPCGQALDGWTGMIADAFSPREIDRAAARRSARRRAGNATLDVDGREFRPRAGLIEPTLLVNDDDPRGQP